MKWNISNMWRLSFAITFIGIFFLFMNWKLTGEFLGIIGGVMLICMGCWRVEDIKDFLDRNSR